jgi:hypothetical protein
MTNAAFWIITAQYKNEVRQSMVSVYKAMPDLPRHLLVADEDLPPRQYDLWYLDFVNYMNLILTLGVDKVLFLDSDTYMCTPVPEIFDILDRFDIVSTIAPARVISPTSRAVPATFAEYNTGVLAFRNNDRVKELFRSWFELYKQHPDLYGENDQAPLREAMWQWDGRPYVLPQEYNCRFGFGGQAAGMIKILHGRSGNMSALAKAINDNQGIRGWRRGDFS